MHNFKWIFEDSRFWFFLLMFILISPAVFFSIRKAMLPPLKETDPIKYAQKHPSFQQEHYPCWYWSEALESSLGLIKIHESDFLSTEIEIEKTRRNANLKIQQAVIEFRTLDIPKQEVIQMSKDAITEEIESLKGLLETYRDFLSEERKNRTIAENNLNAAQEKGCKGKYMDGEYKLF